MLTRGKNLKHRNSRPLILRATVKNKFLCKFDKLNWPASIFIVCLTYATPFIVFAWLYYFQQILNQHFDEKTCISSKLPPGPAIETRASESGKNFKILNLTQLRVSLEFSLQVQSFVDCGHQFSPKNSSYCTFMFFLIWLQIISTNVILAPILACLVIRKLLKHIDKYERKKSESHILDLNNNVQIMRSSLNYDRLCHHNIFQKIEEEGNYRPSRRGSRGRIKKFYRNFSRRASIFFSPRGNIRTDTIQSERRSDKSLQVPSTNSRRNFSKGNTKSIYRLSRLDSGSSSHNSDCRSTLWTTLSDCNDVHAIDCDSGISLSTLYSREKLSAERNCLPIQTDCVIEHSGSEKLVSNKAIPVSRRFYSLGHENES